MHVSLHNLVFRHTLSAALVSHQVPRTSPSPFNICRASLIVSCRRCSWLKMNPASSGLPVYVLTSTISRLWFTRFRTDTSCGRTRPGESADWERVKRALGAPRGGGSEARRSWMSYTTRASSAIPVLVQYPGIREHVRLLLLLCRRGSQSP